MRTRRSLLALPALVAAFVVAMPELHAQTPTAAPAAQRLIEATAPAQRGELLLPFTEAGAQRLALHAAPARRLGLEGHVDCATRGHHGFAAHGAE